MFLAALNDSLAVSVQNGGRPKPGHYGGGVEFIHFSLPNGETDFAKTFFIGTLESKIWDFSN